jgi:cytochrome c551/c552
MRLPAAARAGILESAKQLAPTTADRRYVLTVDPGCVYCHEIAPRFRDLAARFGTVADFAILAADGEYEASSAVDVVVDATAYRELAPSWSPGLLLVGVGGVLLDVAPGGDLESLEKMLVNSSGSATAKTATTEVTP